MMPIRLQTMEQPTTNAAAHRAEFQILLRLQPEPNEDHDLEQVAEISLEALRNEAAGLALGVVASVDLDHRTVELEMTVEVSSASEVHQKMGLILAALERGAPSLILCQSTASRSAAHELVCA